MGGELLIATNPHRRKGHRSKAQRSASLRNIKKAQAARRSGRTHRRRANPESRTERSRAAKLGWHRRRANPESRTERSRAAKLGWRRRRHHRTHPRRSNPIRMGGFMGQLTPALFGAGGAVVNDLGYNLIAHFLPVGNISTQLTTGTLRHAGKTVSAFALSWVASMFLHPRTAEAIGTGALTVVGYNIAKDVVGKFAPQLPLGCYDGAGGMAAYVDGYQSPGAGAGVIDMRNNPNPQLAAYVGSSPSVGIGPQLSQPAGVQLEGYSEGY